MPKSSCVLMQILIIVAMLSSPSIASATTKWWKITPNTCSVSTYDIADLDNSNFTGELKTTHNPLTVKSGYAYCPVFLPNGVTINKLRIRSFQSGGLPYSTAIGVSLYKRKWDSAYSNIASAFMYEGGYVR